MLAGIEITEFMAKNNDTLIDGDGNSADWIELFNPGPGSADLGGHFLTDDLAAPMRWRWTSTPGSTVIRSATPI